MAENMSKNYKNQFSKNYKNQFSKIDFKKIKINFQKLISKK